MKIVSTALTLLLAATGVARAQTQQDRMNPQMKAVIDSLSGLKPKPLFELPAAEARHQPSATDAVIQLMQTKGNPAPEKLPPVGMVEMRGIDGPAGKIPVRVYTPFGKGPFPVIVYFHGGGWVIATVDTYDPSCRALVDLTGAVLVSVEYAKAPEHKFPAAHEDCYAALQYVAGHAAEFGGDPAKIAVVGESAGGNLATGVCMMAAMRGGKMPIHQALVYPITDYNFDTPSYNENVTTMPLNKPAMQWFYAQYLNGPEDGKNVLASPLRATPEQLMKLPPATVVTAQIDPLRSDGQLYANKLTAAGVDCAAKTYDGVTHEFFGMGVAVDTAMDAEKFVAGRLKDAFKK